MSGQIMWGRFLAMTALIMTAGYGIMYATTPTEEALYDRLSPDLKRQVDEIRAKRQTSSGGIRDTLANASAKDQIVWAEELGKSGSRKV